MALRTITLEKGQQEVKLFKKIGMIVAFMKLWGTLTTPEIFQQY